MPVFVQLESSRLSKETKSDSAFPVTSEIIADISTTKYL